MILVSACLVGVKCRYDGQSQTIESLMALYEKGEVIPVCPEVLGGLSVPRVPCEVVKEDYVQQVFSKDGKEYTHEFMEGAKKTLNIAKAAGVKGAILKARSPSCGSNLIYDGTFSGKLVSGNGMTANLLKLHDIPVYTEEDMEVFLNDLKSVT